MISLNIEKTFGFISKESVSAYEAQVKAAQEALENGTGKGNDFLGWLHLPSSISKEHLADLNASRYRRKLPGCPCGDRGIVKQLHLVTGKENSTGHDLCRPQYW